MPTTECSFCSEHIDARPWNESDTMFDWQCPDCGRPVLIDGNAKEKRRQRQVREQISNQIQEFADELDTPGYEPAPYSVEQMRDRLELILDSIDEELDQR